jgi:hypothetical protein
MPSAASAVASLRPSSARRASACPTAASTPIPSTSPKTASATTCGRTERFTVARSARVVWKSIEAPGEATPRTRPVNASIPSSPSSRRTKIPSYIRNGGYVSRNAGVIRIVGNVAPGTTSPVTTPMPTSVNRRGRPNLPLSTSALIWSGGTWTSSSSTSPGTTYSSVESPTWRPRLAAPSGLANSSPGSRGSGSRPCSTRHRSILRPTASSAASTAAGTGTPCASRAPTPNAAPDSATPGSDWTSSGDSVAGSSGLTRRLAASVIRSRRSKALAVRRAPARAASAAPPPTANTSATNVTNRHPP